MKESNIWIMDGVGINMRNVLRKIRTLFPLKRIDNSKLAGLLGTLIFHLIAAIIFMLFQVRTLQKQNYDLIEVEFEPAEEVLQEEKQEIKLTSIEQILQGDNEMLNIARNLANRSDQSVNREAYIDMVKEEMIRNGQLGEENYIDEQKKLPAGGEENLAMESEKAEKKDNDQPTEAQKMEANYKGPTRIYYELEGRNHTYLPKPIYKCEGSGKVVLSIAVSLQGYVTDVSVLEAQSTASDPCLMEAAVKAAGISRFNSDINAPKSQKGTITYLFVAQ